MSTSHYAKSIVTPSEEDDLSGYGTDTSLENTGTNASSSDETNSDEQFDGSDDSGEEEIGSRIDYLHQKQSLLARASHALSSEESYNAATAISTVDRAKKGESHLPRSGLWAEAMDVLRALGDRNQSPDGSNHPRGVVGGHKMILSGAPASSSVCRKRKNPKDPAIDVSSVERLPSVKFATRQQYISTGDGRVLDLLTSLPSCIFHKGQWMAQALVWSAPVPVVERNHQNKKDLEQLFKYRWKMDPSTHSVGLLPPNGIFMDHAVSMQEALSFCNDGRVVTQAIPPFCIVYANRAFLEIAGFGPDSESAIGRPIESILQVDRGAGGRVGATATDTALCPRTTAPSDNCLTGFFPNVGNRARRVRLFPVLDRSRRRKLSSGSRDSTKSSSSSDATTKTKEYSCMSHILIQVSLTDESPRSEASALVSDNSNPTTRDDGKAGDHGTHHHDHQQQQRYKVGETSSGLPKTPSEEILMGMVG